MIFTLGMALIGTAIGSFLNALEYRVHREESIMVQDDGKAARSRCVHCAVAIENRDLVPVLSFVLLRGKCRACRKPIAWQYPMVELATGALFALAAWRYGLTIETVTIAVYMALLMFIFIYDLKYQLILDVVTFPAMAVAAVASVLVFGRTATDLFFGVLIGGGFFLAQYVLSRGKWIGGGDVRLGIVLGLMLGWQQTILVLFVAYILGSIVGLALMITRKAKMRTQLPFGTFLAIGAVIALLAGDWLIDWYLNFLV